MNLNTIIIHHCFVVCCNSVNTILIVSMSAIIKYCQVKYLIINEICPNKVFYYISFICVFVMFYLFLS